MEIYEKIFARLEELHMTQLELSRRTGIATSTICDWKKKKINPQSDKLVSICKALEMPLVDLLCDEEDRQNQVLISDYTEDDKTLIESIVGASPDIKKRVIRYFELLSSLENDKASATPQRNVAVVQDADGKNIVLINDIIFKSRRLIDWDDIEKILKDYIGKYYEIVETAEKVFIGSDFPDEFAHSKYTKALKGANEKAKANSISAIGELVSIADSKAEYPDYEKKHGNKAKYGWYRYNTRFGIPVYNEYGDIERYNVFNARMLIRRDENKKLYLYDIVQIKKETSKPHR